MVLFSGCPNGGAECGNEEPSRRETGRGRWMPRRTRERDTSLERGRETRAREAKGARHGCRPIKTDSQRAILPNGVERLLETDFGKKIVKFR
jgi:hypothetical protein